jgi:DNA repair protein RadC
MSTTYQSFRIADMLPEMRPRERLEKGGPESLTTPELLAILFRTGTPKRNAVQVAEDLCRDLGGLAGIATASLDQLASIEGIGRVKAIEVKAAVELAKRLAATQEEAKPVIRSPADAAHLMMAELRYETREHLCALILDARNQVRHTRKISTGTLTESLVHPREVFREAIQFSAAAIILVHNHPSGDPDPSPEDIATTKRLTTAGKVVGIEVLDHIVIGDGRWTSLKQRNLM